MPLLGEEARPADAGAVIEKIIRRAAAKSTFLRGGQHQNNTRQTAADIAAEIENPLPFAIEPNSPDPQVLVMHTHATEDYRLSAGLWFAPGDGARSTDCSVNMCAVGRVVADTLNVAGINTLHDETLNDYPSYTGSYANSRAVVQQYLSQYPSIKIVLDVHRDAIETENGSRMAPVCTVNGRQAAQVMIICGCDNGTTVSLPNYRLNLRFAAAWETAMEACTPLHPPGPVQLPVLQSGSDPRQPAHRDRRARQQPERGLYAGQLAANADPGNQKMPLADQRHFDCLFVYDAAQDLLAQPNDLLILLPHGIGAGDCAVGSQHNGIGSHHMGTVAAP